MPTPNFIFTLNQATWDKFHTQTYKHAAGIANSENSPNIGADANTRTYTVFDISYGDFTRFHKSLRNALYENINPIPQVAAEWASMYGTPEFRKAEEDRIIESREELRDFPGGDTNPNDAVDLDDDADGLAGTKDILAGDAPGMCFGHGHGQKEAYKFLAKIADDPKAFGDGGGMLFVEELPGALQDEITAYLTATDEPEWSEDAKAFFNSTTQARELEATYTLEATLKKARENNILVFAIDSGECTPASAAEDASPEQRCANMNAYAKRVMDKAIKDNPDRKFVAFCGAAHSNTHEGGVPGFSQIYDIPAVTMNDNGTIVKDEEDRSLRGMPSKELQLFVDNYLKGYDEDCKKNVIANDKKPKDPKKAAMELGQKLERAGKLPDSTGKSNEEFLKLIKEMTAKIPKTPALRFEAAKQRIAKGQGDDLELLVAGDPDIVMTRESGGKNKGKNLLEFASKAGAKGSSDLLRGTMLTHGEDMLANGKTLDTDNLAELVIIKAENKAWAGDDDDKPGAVDVNFKKHNEMVKKLTETLKKNVANTNDQTKVVNTLSGALSKDGGLYKKTGRSLSKRDPDHVSIDKKKASKIWVQKLATL